MGNREDLLDGAVRCLREKGWGRTTVRDIAAASGVSHAAIGYHYGSREALLSAALVRAMDDWGAEIGQALGGASDPVARWTAMVSSFVTQRSMWAGNVDALVQAEHAPALRERLADAQEEGRRGSAAGLLGIEEGDLPEEAVRTVGSVHMALISGVMVQCLIDPDRAPSGAEVVAGLRALVAAMDRPEQG